MSKLDQSLDSIIEENKKGGRGRGRGGRGRGRGGRGRGGRSSFSSFSEPSNPLAREADGDEAGPERRERFNRSRSRGAPYSREDDHVAGDSESDWKHDMFRGPGGDSGARSSGTPGVARVEPVSKILVSGLDVEVSSDDVKEIFASIGGISRAVVHYDQNGKSLGTAEVTFNTTAAATKAVKEFDGAEVDGKPMFIKVVGSVIPAPRVVTKRPNRDFVQRSGKSAMFGSAMHDDYDDDYRPARRGGRGGARGGGRGAGRGSRGGSRGGGGRGRGGRGGKEGGGGGKKEKSNSSTSGADLDAELDAYQKQRGASGAAADAPAA